LCLTRRRGLRWGAARGRAARRSAGIGMLQALADEPPVAPPKSGVALR